MVMFSGYEILTAWLDMLCGQEAELAGKMDATSLKMGGGVDGRYLFHSPVTRVYGCEKNVPG